MPDLAVGPITGFLFQFEKALLILARFNNSNDSMSVENVDDIAVHDPNESEKILITYQAKHSLSASGSAFEDTSKALWRTLEIWIQKLERGIFSDETRFVCTTNKKINDDSLLMKLRSLPFEEVMKAVDVLLKDLKRKQAEKKKEGEKALHIAYIIKLITFAQKKKDLFQIIARNIVIEDQQSIEPQFLETMRLNVPDITEARRKTIYETCYGWLLHNCTSRWRDSNQAIITKAMFDSKWNYITTSPQLINTIFRKKNQLGTLTAEKQALVKDELFVRQLNDIERGAGKDKVMEKAVLDFIHHEIEMSFVIDKGDFTSADFEEFSDNCQETWNDLFYAHVVDDEYDEAKANTIAIAVFDKTMSENTLSFGGGFKFDINNRYIRNGCFLKLSNVPKIGWRPDWEIKYRKND